MTYSSKFLMTVCQAGAEKLLKDEFARDLPELRFSYSRPGFVTFKNADEKRLFTPDFALKSVFARAFALSAGKAAGAPELLEAAAKLRVSVGLGERKFRLHVFERDRFVPGEEPPGFEPRALAEQALQSIEGEAARSGTGLFEEEALAREGDPVLSVVIVEESEWWLGYHVQGPGHSPYPGGDPQVELPKGAPSRAYLKLEEAVIASGAPLNRGDTAVEIGSSPGGASFALLQRGLQVIGIDPAEMDPRVVAHPSFQHLRAPVAAVRREDLPAKIDWLLLDMNVAPSVTLHQVERLAGRMKDTLKGVILTFKLNEPEFAIEIPEWIERVRALGMSRVKALQLRSNKREICIVGVTRIGASPRASAPARK